MNLRLSLEIYSLIVANVGNRADICSLTRVSKAFHAAAERALYNTLLMMEPTQTMTLCSLLARQPRVASLVIALTISTDEGSVDSDSDESSFLPSGYWELVHRALRRTNRLRHLNIYLEAGDSSALSWILLGCSFQLRSFHCDFAWDVDLVSFLASQSDLSDLHVSDFDGDIPNNVSISLASPRSSRSLPRLAVLECTFIDAVALFAHGRPLTHIKTCFSRTNLVEKHAEMARLASNLRLTTTPLRSLNVPDSSYDTLYSLSVVACLVKTLQPSPRLAYLGPFVLPVDGNERLRLYGLLRQLPHLQAVEVEVSAWNPLPVSLEALRSLSRELRLYAAAVTTVIFLAELEQTVMRRTANGRWVVDDDANPDTLWRDV